MKYVCQVRTRANRPGPNGANATNPFNTVVIRHSDLVPKKLFEINRRVEIIQLCGAQLRLCYTQKKTKRIAGNMKNGSDLSVLATSLKCKQICDEFHTNISFIRQVKCIR